jgi:peptidoglycan-N-acetylglucosamine deacetylase
VRQKTTLSRPILDTVSQHYARLTGALYKRAERILNYRADMNRRSSWDGHFLGLRLGGPAKRRIHLTFDDGPHPVNTPKMLDELRRAGVSATFFVLGTHLESPQAQALLQRIVDEGHQVGNHTYSHCHLTDLRKETVRKEILRTEELIGDANRGIKLLRPPHGDSNYIVEQVARELGYTLVFWNVDTCDWQPKYQDLWVDHAMEQIVTEQNSIVLAHDRIATTVSNVGALIANIRKLPDSRIVPPSEAFPRKRSVPNRADLRLLFSLRWANKRLGF